MENRRVSGGTDGFFVKQLFSDDGEVHDVFVEQSRLRFWTTSPMRKRWIQGEIVTFEETLKARLEEARHSSAPKSAVEAVLNGSDAAVVEQMVSTRMDENGVNVTEQSAEMIRNAYQLQYVMSAMNSDLSTLRTAIQG